MQLYVRPTEPCGKDLDDDIAIFLDYISFFSHALATNRHVLKN